MPDQTMTNQTPPRQIVRYPHRMSVPNLNLPQSCDSTVQVVRWQDLPLACPVHGTMLWNAHQRVYLPIHRTGREQCYYCGTVYILEELDPDAPTPEFSNNKIEKYYHMERERILAKRASEHAASSATPE